MKKSSDIIGNRTRDLPACSVVPQPIALPRASPPQPIYARKKVSVPILQELGGLQGGSRRVWTREYSFNLAVQPLTNDYSDYSERLAYTRLPSLRNHVVYSQNAKEF